MQKILLLFFIPFSLLSSQAQSFELNEQKGQYTEINSALSIDNGKWFLGGGYNKSNSLSTHRPYMQLLNEGGTIWGKNGDGFINKVSKIKRKGEFAFQLGTIYVISNDVNYIQKIQLQDSSVVELNDSWISGENIFLYDLEVLSNGKVIVVGEDLDSPTPRVFFKEFSNDLEMEQEITDDIGFIHDIEILNDSTFLVAGKIGINNTHGIELYNLDYEKIEEYWYDMSVDKIEMLNDGNFFIAEKENLFIATSDFQIYKSIILSDYGKVIDIESDENSIIVLAQGEDSPPTILEYNYDYELVNSLTYGSRFLRIRDLVLSQEEIAITGYVVPSFPLEYEVEYERPHLSTSGFFKSIPRSLEVEIPSNDLKIVDVRIPFFKKENECLGKYNRGFVNIDINNVLVDIVNNGNDTISGGNLFIEMEGLITCSDRFSNNETTHLKKEIFFNQNIPPNDTTTLNIPDFEIFQRLSKSYHVDLCAWVTAIDRKLDTNEENDFFCGKVRLPGVNFLDSKELVGVYPNPANDFLNISFKYTYPNNTELKIFNSIGVCVYKNTLSIPSNKKSLSIAKLPPGIYFLSVENDEIKETVGFTKRQ